MTASDAPVKCGCSAPGSRARSRAASAAACALARAGDVGRARALGGVELDVSADRRARRRAAARAGARASPGAGRVSASVVTISAVRSPEAQQPRAGEVHAERAVRARRPAPGPVEQRGGAGRVARRRARRRRRRSRRVQPSRTSDHLVGVAGRRRAGAASASRQAPTRSSSSRAGRRRRTVGVAARRVRPSERGGIVAPPAISAACRARSRSSSLVRQDADVRPRGGTAR